MRNCISHCPDDDPPCHEPGDDPDLNNHLNISCELCSGHATFDGPQLRYIELKKASFPVRDTSCPRQNQSRKDLADVQAGIDQVRRDVCCLHARQWDCLRMMMYILTQRLLCLEDNYRRLGARYYSSAWFATREHVGFDSMRYCTLAAAFHGSEQRREFFQPWRDFESDISRVANLIANAPYAEAREGCIGALQRAPALECSMQRLESYVR